MDVQRYSSVDFFCNQSGVIGDSRDGTPSGPKKIIMKLHTNGGRASTQQIKRACVRRADEVLEHFEVRRAFDGAPGVRIAGTSKVSMFNEKMQVSLCVAHNKCLPRIFAVSLRPLGESPGGSGCLFELVDWHAWATEAHPNGCRG